MAADKPLISTFQEAARIAESVPEQYREAAFQRALDALLSPMPVPDSREAPQTAPKKIGHEQEPRVGGNNALERLLSAVDSSAHQKIHDAPSLLDRCLIVLRIAKSNYGVDGLTTTEVGTVLTSKFRLRASQRGIRKALAEAGRLVDRVPEGNGFRYRIMEAGEQHVDALSAVEHPNQQTEGRNPGWRGRRRTRRAARKVEPPTDVGGAVAPPNEQPIRRRRDATVKRTGGPIVQIRALIAGGWFASPRTVQDILKELARRGSVYKRTDLTRQMINLIRSGELHRNKRAVEGSDRGVWHYSTPNG